MAPLIIHKLQDLHKFPWLPFAGVEPADSLAHAFRHRVIGIAARLRVAVAVAGASQARRQLPLHRRSCRPHLRLARRCSSVLRGELVKLQACILSFCAGQAPRLLQRQSCRPRAGEDPGALLDLGAQAQAPQVCKA